MNVSIIFIFYNFFFLRKVYPKIGLDVRITVFYIIPDANGKRDVLKIDGIAFFGVKLFTSLTDDARLILGLIRFFPFHFVDGSFFFGVVFSECLEVKVGGEDDFLVNFSSLVFFYLIDFILDDNYFSPERGFEYLGLFFHIEDEKVEFVVGKVEFVEL